MASMVSDLGRVQKVRKTVLLACCGLALVVVLFTSSTWAAGGGIHNTIRWLGIGLILACIIGRCWASLYIAGNKSRSLTTTGPYSIVRNPLYCFSILGAAGIGAQLGSVVVTLAAGLLCWGVFRAVTAKEEFALLNKFGRPYAEYLETVPRFVPNFRLWRDEPEITVRPRVVATTLFDSLFFLLGIPLGLLIQWAQLDGIIAVLLRLP